MATELNITWIISVLFIRCDLFVAILQNWIYPGISINWKLQENSFKTLCGLCRVSEFIPQWMEVKESFGGTRGGNIVKSRHQIWLLIESFYVPFEWAPTLVTKPITTTNWHYYKHTALIKIVFKRMQKSLMQNCLVFYEIKMSRVTVVCIWLLLQNILYLFSSLFHSLVCTGLFLQNTL